MSYFREFVLLGLLLGTPAFASAGSLSLAWDPSPDASVVGYVVQWGDRAGQLTDEVDVGEVSSHTIDGLADGRTYYVVVRSRTVDGTRSGPSNQASGVVGGPSAGGPPSAPTPDPPTNPPPGGSTPTPDPESDSTPEPESDPIPELQVSFRRTADFDGDLKDDVAVYRPLKISLYELNGPSAAVTMFSSVTRRMWFTGVWQVLGSTGLELFISDLEIRDADVVPVPADYDGDGVTDLAHWSSSSGRWVTYESGNHHRWTEVTHLGSALSIPVPADYDGDGVADIAVVEPGGLWQMLEGQPRQFGSHGDIPVPADYDGDGTADIAVFRPSDGTWHVAEQFDVSFGAPGDVPVPADYDGDGRVDVAVFRPSIATWYVRGQFQVTFGLPDDTPFPLDIDGDGRAELIVSRPTDGDWFLFDPRTGFSETIFYGEPGDVVASVPLFFRTIASALDQQ